MRKTHLPEASHIRLSDASIKALDVISDFLKSQGNRGSRSDAVRFAAIQLANRLTAESLEVS